MLPLVFHLYRDDALLAVLEFCRPGSEMFWVACSFKPMALFAEVEPLFHEASETEDMDIFEHNYKRLRDMGVVLVDVVNNIRIKYYVLHIEEDRVELRYAEPPYEYED